MSNTTSKSNYKTVTIVLSFLVGFLGIRLYMEISKNYSDAQSLRKGNEQIYKELEIATEMMIVNSDILMRFAHYEHNHDANNGQSFLCPECTSPWPPEKSPSKWGGFTLTDEELEEMNNNAMLYDVEEAIYDTKEVATQIQRLTLSLSNQHYKLKYSLLKMRSDSLKQQQEKEEEKGKPQRNPSRGSILAIFKQKIQNKDGSQGLEDFHDAVETNIRPELHDKLVPLVAAIRYAENGRAGREYGILHPNVKPTYRSQAGWCAATVQKNWDRYKQQGGDTENLEEYIAFLGNIYCPLNDSNDIMGLNNHWKKNVLYFYRNF